MNMIKIAEKLNSLEQRGLMWKSGLVGVGLISLGMLLSGLAYRGRLAEKYSPFNHFVSELGEVGVSEMAAAFNLGLLLGGLCLVVFMVCLARRIGGWQGVLFGITGVICGGSSMMVGAFPMNNLQPHVFWAMNFFNGGLWAMLLFSLIALFSRQNLPRWLALPGLFSMLAFTAFRFFPNTTTEDVNSLSAVELFQISQRPGVLVMAVFEWLAVVGVLLWALVVALAMKWDRNTGS